jgi:MarR family 2-MHQ and catechol resistance regulon transcriptional repressor
MMKAVRALTKYTAEGIEDTGLGDSDFRVPEVLLHRGRMPVSTICPYTEALMQ